MPPPLRAPYRAVACEAAEAARLADRAVQGYGERLLIARRVAPAIKPRLDLVGVEPEQVSPLEERDTAFCDQPTDVALIHAQAFGDGGQVHQRGSDLAGGHRNVLSTEGQLIRPRRPATTSLKPLPRSLDPRVRLDDLDPVQPVAHGVGRLTAQGLGDDALEHLSGIGGAGFIEDDDLV